MRKRSLSREGCRLFATGMIPIQGRTLLCGLFHSDYDDRLSSVLHSCRQSAQVLCTYEDDENLEKMLNTGILQTIKLIISENNKKVSKRQMKRNFKFFLDIMIRALQTEDHQTAGLMYMALTHPIIKTLNLKKTKHYQKHIQHFIERQGCVLNSFGPHISEFINIRHAGYIPSLIAIHIWNRSMDANSVKKHELESIMEVYKYMFRGILMPLYQLEHTTLKDIINM